MNKAKKYMASAGKELTKIGQTLTLGITAPIVGMGVAAVKSASDLAEVQNVVDTVFGDSAESVNKWAKEAIKSYGLSELSAKQFAGTMRSMLGSMGLSASEADKMSLSLSGLAGDMASFYNLDPTEAFEKLRSGIAGEVEPLKQLGINMSVANMEAYALSKGIETAWKDMSQAEQATLRYGYIMETTANAQGDFAKTNTGLANSMRILKEQLVSIGSQFGAILLPYIEKFVMKIRGVLDVFMGLNPEMQKNIMIVAGIAAAIGPMLLILGKLSTSISSLIMWMSGISRACAQVVAGTKGVGAILTAVLGPAGVVIAVIAGIVALVGGIMYLWKTNEGFRSFIQNTWQAIVDFMTPILENIKNVIINAWNSVVEYVTPIIIAIKEIIIEAWQYVMSTVQPILEQLMKAIESAWEFIKTATKILWDIVKKLFSTSLEVIKNVVFKIVDTIKWIWNNFGTEIKQFTKNAWDAVTIVFKNAFKILQNTFDIFTGLLTGNWSKCWEGIKGVVSSVWSAITGVVKKGVNSVISIVNAMIGGLNKLKVPDWIPGIGGKGVNIPKIPYLAKGTSYFRGGLAVVGKCLPTLNRAKSVKSKLILWIKKKKYGIINMWDRLGVINLIDKERQTLLPI